MTTHLHKYSTMQTTHLLGEQKLGLLTRYAQYLQMPKISTNQIRANKNKTARARKKTHDVLEYD